MIKQTPLHSLHIALGAKMVPFANYDMPVQYDGILTEHNHVRHAAGLFDVSHMGQIIVRGPNAAAALEKLMPGDIQNLRVDGIRYSLLLNDQGGAIDDLMVTNRGNYLLLVVNASRKDIDFEYLTQKCPGLDISYWPDRALLALQGPKAARIMQSFIDCDTLGFMSCVEATIDGIDVLISRCGYTGEDGFEISVNSDLSERLAKILLDFSDVRPIGLGARDTLRLEAGLCLYGHELDESTNPVEAGLNFAINKSRKVSFDFAGGTIIQQELAQGTKRKLIGIRPEGRTIARDGTKIFDHQNNEIGIVTSGTFSPTLQAPIALGYVKSEYTAPGTALQLMVRDKLHPAIVSDLPFVPHRYFK